MSVTLFVLAVIGLTCVLVDGKILDDKHTGIRSWLKKRLGRFSDGLDCYFCTGLWAGLLVGLFFNPWLVPVYGVAGAGIMRLYQIGADFVASHTNYPEAG